MVSSALISYNLVRSNDEEIMNLRNSAKNKEMAIQHVWQANANNESKVNAAIIISLLTLDKKPYKQIAHKYLGAKTISPESLIALIEKTEIKKKEAIKTINNIYQDKLEIENNIAKKSQKNKFYTMAAVFMQLLGIILISLHNDLK